MPNGTLDMEFHVLLIGIDAYPVKPLHGCVNDIDAVQRLLLQKAGVPASRIKRLASPHADAQQDTTVPERPATLANMRAAFEALGSDKVRPTDRVFIYYAGHGGRVAVPVGEQTVHRECLVPIDGQNEALYDFELNSLIANITKRTRAVALILDCCHSMGATRNLQQPGMTARFIDFESQPGVTRPVTLSAQQAQLLGSAARGITGGIAENVDDCQIVAGCLNHEEANESTLNGVRHGLLTRALISAMEGVSADDVTTVPWGRLWNRLRADVETENPAQHLWISGGLARAWLAGPPADGDTGLGIVRVGDEYHIDAGSLTGITPGAQLAVYGDRPARFPRLGSDEDHSARFSEVLLEVKGVTRSTATARALGDPFDVPPGARARLVKAGEAERLPCAVVPEDEAIVAALAASSLLHVTSEREALARLERQPDGTWTLTDDVHSAQEGEPVLFNIRLGPDDADQALSLMEHYVRYAGPIRMAKLCTDLPGALQVRLLQCPKTGTVSPEAAPELPEVETRSGFPWELSAGDRFCVRVRNTSGERLRVTLLNSAASGKVEFLGDQVIDSAATHVFWLRSTVGAPFTATLPAGSTQCIDRMVVIGTTALGSDLKHMTERKRFGESSRDLGAVDESPPADQWTAMETIVRTRAT